MYTSTTGNKGSLSITHFPEQGDTSVLLESFIGLVFKSDLDISTFTQTSLTLTRNTEQISGRMLFTDTSVFFIPNSELKPNSTYKVAFKTSAIVFPEDAEVKDRRKTITENWTFVTGGDPVYTMHLTTTAVTDFDRDGSKLMQMGDYVYSYGGWTAEPLKSYSDIYRSNGDLSKWEKMPDAPWEGRHTFGIGKIDSTLYIFGGDHLSTGFDVWSTRDGYNFTAVSQNIQHVLGARILYGACEHKSKLFLLGGQASFDLNAGLTDVWSSADGFEWNKIASDLPFLGKNISGSVVSFNDRIWVLGGGYYKDPDSIARWTSFVLSSPDGVKWKREPKAPWAGRQYTDVCVWDNKLWMVGGHNGDNMSDIWYMNRYGLWKEYETPPEFSPRHAAAVGVFNDELVIACGNYHNDCWVIKKE